MMSKTKEFQILKWNIYLANVPFTVNFSRNKLRPVVVVGYSGDDVIILPITSNVGNIQKTNIKIQLLQTSIIKVASIQSIHKNHVINPYYIKKQIVKIDFSTRTKIKKILFHILY